MRTAPRPARRARLPFLGCPGAARGRGRDAWVDVAVANLWAEPDQARPLDAPSLANPVDIPAWLAAMTVDDRRWLVDRLVTQVLYGDRVTVVDVAGDVGEGGRPPPAVDARPPRVPRLAADGPAHGRRARARRRRRGGGQRPRHRPARPRRHRPSPADVELQHPPAGPASPAPRASPSPHPGAVGACWYPATSTSSRPTTRRRRATTSCAAPSSSPASTTCGRARRPSGWDCSGLTSAAYAAHGVVIPRDADDQAEAGTPVDRADLRPGDLLFLRRRQRHPRGHVRGRRAHDPGPRHRPSGGDGLRRRPRPGRQLPGRPPLPAVGVGARGRLASIHGPAIHLHDARPPSLLPARPRGPQGDQHLHVPGGQDRRHRVERVGQVVPPAHHGRRGRRLHRRGPPPPRRHRRPPGPGAAARRVPRRLRQRALRRGRDQGRPRPLQRGVRGHGRPRRRLRQAAGRAGRPAGQDRRGRRLGPRPHPRDRHGRPAPAPGRRRGVHAVRRRAAAGGPVPAAPVPARPAPAGRAHQPPRRRVGGVAGAVPVRVPGDGGGRHPRPLLPRQRGRLDPRAGAGRGAAVGGQLLVVAGAEAGPPGPGGEVRLRPPADPGPGAGVGADVAPGPPGQGQGPADLVREAGGGGGGRSRQGGEAGDLHPARSPAGRRGGRGRGAGQGLRRPPADRRAVLRAAAGRASSGSSGPTGRARRPCSA